MIFMPKLHEYEMFHIESGALFRTADTVQDCRENPQALHIICATCRLNQAWHIVPMQISDL